MAVTANYALIKPVVGGSENEWGRNLNDDLDKIDALLGGDQPVNGIKIETGEIAGSAIVGSIGEYDDDDAPPLEIHESTQISGKVKKLTGMDDPDGVIENVDLVARSIECEGAITEANAALITSTTATLSIDQGTIHSAKITENQTYTYNMAMPISGQGITLMIDKQTSSATNIVWKHNGVSNAIKWIGGGEPDLNTGINVIQFWTANAGNGTGLFGAYSGVAS
jgi:hypothetical protein